MNQSGRRTTLLCILDGFGLNPNPVGNAVHLAHTPNFDRLYAECPTTTLVTCGERVGLPAGQMGNSEVGHLNIGAGRVVEQWLVRIGRELRGDFLDRTPEFKNFLAQTKDSGALHLIGLYSDGGVHSHLEHLQLLIKKLARSTKTKIVLHLITDGRDTGPQQARAKVAALEHFIKDFPQCTIATVIGRFYAMDRDKRWERVRKAYDAFTGAVTDKAQSASAWIAASYEKGITDEFIEPAVITSNPIRNGDGVIFWNFREDRMREIVGALCVKDFPGFERPAPTVPTERVLCFTDYDHTYHLPFLFAPIEIKNHIGELLSGLGLKQLRVAETEKYPHVTYFFNGGVEKEYQGEDRKLVPSPRDVKTYDLKPEMSAHGVTEIVLEGLRSRQYDFIVVNLANCDMVGHTGVLDAAIKAVETVDECLGQMAAELAAQDGHGIVIADHGNAEQMINYEDGTPHTAHTTFPVPLIALGYTRGAITLKDGGALCDVAPTLLKMMNVPQPPEMTGKSLY